MLAARDRGQDQFLCGFVTAYEFGYDIDIRIVHNVRRIRRQYSRRYGDTAVAFDVANGNLCNLDRHTYALPDQIRILLKNAKRTSTDGAKTDQPDIDFF